MRLYNQTKDYDNESSQQFKNDTYSIIKNIYHNTDDDFCIEIIELFNYLEKKSKKQLKHLKPLPLDLQEKIKQNYQKRSTTNL
jgi:hypothetical protein